jgi:hypothetical protein
VPVVIFSTSAFALGGASGVVLLVLAGLAVFLGASYRVRFEYDHDSVRIATSGLFRARATRTFPRAEIERAALWHGRVGRGRRGPIGDEGTLLLRDGTEVELFPQRGGLRSSKLRMIARINELLRTE